MTQSSDPIIPHLGLLVLDIQAPFLKAFPVTEPFLSRIKFCVEVARLFRIPTLFTEQRPEILQSTLPELIELNPDAPRIAKTGFSAFTEASVMNWVNEHDLHHLLIAGLETPICVYQSVLDAMNREVDITLLSDAVGCRRPDDAAFIYDSLRKEGSHILPSEAVFYSILSDSLHSQFKEFTQLVKKYSD